MRRLGSSSEEPEPDNLPVSKAMTKLYSMREDDWIGHEYTALR